MSMVVLDEDRTFESREFVKKLVNTETFRLTGGTAREVEDVHGFCRSRNRQHLVLACSDGLA